MIFAVCTRRELLDVLDGTTSPRWREFRHLELPKLGPEGLLLLEQNPVELRGQLPAVVVVAPGSRREFFAWAHTYLEGYLPITAASRVLDSSELLTVDRQNVDDANAAWVGLILGHAMGRRHQIQVTLADCLNTLSFAIGRCSVAGIGGHARSIEESWGAAHRLVSRLGLSGQSGVRDGSEPARMLLDLAPTRPSRALLPVVDALGALRAGQPELQRLAVATLGETLPEGVERALSESRERRMDAFGEVLHLCLKQTRVPEQASLLIAYTLSMASPGTLEYAGLLLDGPEIPQALPLYGLCAGLWPGSRVTDTHNGLARRVSQELRRPLDLLDRPRCDVSVGELDVFASSRRPPQWIMSEPGRLVVEVAPSVCVTFTASGARGQQSMLDDGEFERRAVAMADLRNLLTSVTRVLDQLGVQDSRSVQRKRRSRN